jgi:hypothetical protein
MRAARGRRRRRRDLERESEGDLRRKVGSSSPADVRGKTAKRFSFPVMRPHCLVGSAVLDMIIRSPIHIITQQLLLLVVTAILFFLTVFVLR